MSARGPAAESPTAATVGFPTYDAFADRALAIARPFLDDAPCAPSANGTSDVELVIEGGTPAVDDGGEPLLGSYRPPSAGDATTPSEAPVVTVYYRTFRAIWDDEGAYDWEDELAETLEHEFEHHLFFLRGDDPMDDEERAAIRDEAIRIVGRREVGRRELAGFASSLSDFAARTWPVWLLALVALAFMLVAQR